MSILYRAKQDASSEDYFDQLYKYHGGIQPNNQMAINLRMNFFTKYVLDRRVRDYKTAVEKDWMYIAQREYFYDVQVRSAADASAAGLTACIVRMAMVKKIIWWPMAPVALSVYMYRTR